MTPKRVLITGSEGFIGSHLREEMEANGYEVIRCDLRKAEDVHVMDITNQEQTRQVIAEQRPDILINMAGLADIGLSWKKPQLTVQLNTIGLINILEAVREINKDIRVIAVGSSDEYGALKEKGVNVTEKIPVNPMTPYAISKQSQELFAQLYCRVYGMNVCMTRQFNLSGAGQAKGFILADFASGIAEIEAGKKEYLSVGNLSSARDFTHVRDACKAIRLIAEEGQAGDIYNICSGKTCSAQEILEKMIARAKVKIEVRQDPARLRPSDTPVICGNHDKLTEHTGWMPERNIDDIIDDVLDYWRKQV